MKKDESKTWAIFENDIGMIWIEYVEKDLTHRLKHHMTNCESKSEAQKKANTWIDDELEKVNRIAKQSKHGIKNARAGR